MELSDMLDWLTSEGFAQGHPHKNATWQSLQRHSRDWHDRIALQSLTADEEVTWISALEETCIADIRFIPLTSKHALMREGHEMRHCIGSYAADCIAGRYRAFSVIGTDGARATLGMAVDGGKVIFDQIRGDRNAPVSKAAQKAGKALCRLYASALQERH